MWTKKGWFHFISSYSSTQNIEEQTSDTFSTKILYHSNSRDLIFSSSWIQLTEEKHHHAFQTSSFLLLITPTICYFSVSTSTSRTFLCPCKNEGICTMIEPQSCMCPNGFTGRFCEQLLCENFCSNDKKCIIMLIFILASNSCQQTQCLNGGTCHENSSSKSGSAYCLCKNGYAGKFCEIG